MKTYAEAILEEAKRREEEAADALWESVFGCRSNKRSHQFEPLTEGNQKFEICKMCQVINMKPKRVETGVVKWG